MRYIWMKMMGCFFGFLLLSLPVQAAGTNHVNIAAFQKISSDYSFEAAVMGKFSDFIAAMEQGTEIIFLNHTADVEDHDVISFNADVLREQDGASFGDNGVNCSISVSDEVVKGDHLYALSGMCHLLSHDQGKEEKISVIIPKTEVPDTAQGVDVWMMIYEDKSKGIAFYANVSHTGG